MLLLVVRVLAILLAGAVDKLFAEFKAITLEVVDDEYLDHAQDLQCVALRARERWSVFFVGERAERGTG